MDPELGGGGGEDLLGHRLHPRHPQEHQDGHRVQALRPHHPQHPHHAEGRVDVPHHLPRHHGRLLLRGLLHVQLPEQLRPGLGLQHRGHLHILLLGPASGEAQVLVVSRVENIFRNILDFFLNIYSKTYF